MLHFSRTSAYPLMAQQRNHDLNTISIKEMNIMTVQTNGRTGRISFIGVHLNMTLARPLGPRAILRHRQTPCTTLITIQYNII